MLREIRFYENYFIDFYLTLDEQTQEKIEYVFKIVRTVDRIPQRFLKHIEGTQGLYEIRISKRNNSYRIFSCFDEGKLVILFQGVSKKEQKNS